MKKVSFVAALLAGAAMLVGSALAADLSIVSGDTGNDIELLKKELAKFNAATGNNVTVTTMPSSTTDQFGQYKLWLAAGNTDIDVYQTDVIWAPQLADQLLDLTDAAKDVAGKHFKSIIESQTVNGKLVALPIFTDAPALYYRKDLLEKYKQAVPKTWDEMAAAAKVIQDGEKKANDKFWGFVWQGNAYEGLTCDALEWVKSSGGGQIVEPNGDISINNKNAAAILTTVKGWVGTISPPGVLAYQEEEARGVWQSGNAAFMRNWPYAYGLGNGADSKVKGLFEVTTLPVGPGGKTSAATLGGWNVAVSKYSKHPKEAIALAVFLASAEVQKDRAVQLSHLPTIETLYDDADVAKAAPFIPAWKSVFQQAVPRPSAPAKVKYNEVSTDFFNAVHDIISGKTEAAAGLEALEVKLTKLKGASW